VEPWIYINGRFWKKSEAKVSVFDHGLLYGDGIFETLRAYEGRILFLSRHISRLFASASAIFLQIGRSPDDIREILYQTLAQNHLTDAYIRLSVTRGEGEIGLNPVLCPLPTTIIQAKPFAGHPQEIYQRGIRASLVQVRRNAPQTTGPSIKSLNFLNNILAMQEALRAGAQEAVMSSTDGWVSEGSVSNIFWVRNGVLKTPDLRVGLLAGVTREAVLEIAVQQGLEVDEGYFLPDDLLGADEVFVTNTTYEVMPVTSLGQAPVNNGQVGEINRGQAPVNNGQVGEITRGQAPVNNRQVGEITRGQASVNNGQVGEITRLLLQKYREKIPEFLAEDEVHFPLRKVDGRVGG
jgi:branched-chain amino acid aminotransferase